MLVIVAHPDDEVIGLGAQLPRLRNLTLLHVTDGAPRNLADALAAGFQTAHEYAQARERELEAALLLAGQEHCRRVRLRRPDQESSLHLVELTLQICEQLRAHDPAVVLTHPYEGGHPDHDATAFAVHAAAALLRGEARAHFDLVEFTSYHACDAAMRVHQFLREDDYPPVTVLLSEKDRQTKENLFRCFTTQQQTLRSFSAKEERFRLSPAYVFTQPPHEGPLFYDQFSWGMTGPRWRDLARDALFALGLHSAI